MGLEQVIVVVVVVAPVPWGGCCNNYR